jgi:16S rRNA (guanine966-N2)-methyltransferase
MLASRVGSFEDLRVADLYAGSGALGLEALSRGAAHATFVENDPKAQSAIKANTDKLGVTERARIVGGSALTLPRSDPFDLVFADPPYSPGSGTAVVKAVTSAGWLAPAGWLSIETDRRDPVEPGEYVVELEREIGRARITLPRRP